MTLEKQRVGAGTGVLVNKNSKVLLIKRQGSHGAGSWAPPGGHIEFGETVLECAKREVREEVGFEIANLKVVGFTEDLFKKEKKHYITIWVVCNWASGEPRVNNSEMSKIGWFSWEKLPKPLFIPLKNFIDGKIYPR